METDPKVGEFQTGFNATRSREAIVRRLVLEFAGVELVITPTQTPDDFQKHIHLRFNSAEQQEAFMRKMLQLGQEELARRQQGSLH